MKNWNALAIHARDNVAVALEDIMPDSSVRIAREGKVETLVAAERIPLGHKIALNALAPGESIVKYGEVIGLASAPIAQGHHVHIHNLVSQRARRT